MKKSGIAIIGLGSYAVEVLLPAISQSKYCQLSAIVTGTPVKSVMWSRKFNIPKSGIYDYNNFDHIADNDQVDLVYICLPNRMHYEFIKRSAEAGKHIICEKPLGMNANECKQMIDICEKQNVSLGLGYRLLFDPVHQYLADLHKQDTPSSVQGALGYRIGNKPNWRLDHTLSGGGSLMDLGIYGIQAACYIANQLPTFASAEASFQGLLDMSLNFKLHFENNLFMEFDCSYEEDYNFLHVKAENDSLQLTNAFSTSAIQIKSENQSLDFEPVNAVSELLDSFILSTQQKAPFVANAHLGLRDLQIIEAIYKAAKTKSRVKITYD